MNLEIHFGIFAPTLEEQLKEQGFIDAKCERHQKDMTACTTLYLHSLISDNQYSAIQKKILKEIKASVKLI